MGEANYPFTLSPSCRASVSQQIIVRINNAILLSVASPIHVLRNFAANTKKCVSNLDYLTNTKQPVIDEVDDNEVRALFTLLSLSDQLHWV